MQCQSLGIKGSWNDVLNSARSTTGKGSITKDPSSSWKKRMLLAEHSPIRQLIVKAIWRDLKYWVSVHFVRHWLGILHFVRSQRDDRTQTLGQTHEWRDNQPQSALIEHEIEANAQAIINISRKRLCSCASSETREAWRAFINTFKNTEPELFSVCVPECIYRGFCPEFKSCGLVNTEIYQLKLKQYREVK